MTAISTAHHFERDIRAAADSVAKAKAAHDFAAAEHQRATTARDEVLARINEMTATHLQIVNDRRAGKLAADQGARLAALAADIEIAGEVHAEREQAVGKALKAVNDAQLTVAQAEDKLAQITARAEYDAVISRLREIEVKFLAAVKRAEVLNKTVGGRFGWAPIPELADKLRKIDLQRLDGARGGTAAH